MASVHPWHDAFTIICVHLRLNAVLGLLLFPVCQDQRSGAVFLPILLFKLNGVPDDEAEDIRALLNRNGIDYYETPAGNWAVSVPAIWLNDESQRPQARLLIDQYQRERQIRARGEYLQLQQEGKHRTILDLIRGNPVRFVVYLAAIAVVVYFSTKPFLDIGK